MMNAKAVGKRLQALRRSAGLTQENVAEALGISDNYVSNIETGRDICSMVVLLGMANLYHASMDYILGESLAYNLDKEADGERRAALLHDFFGYDWHGERFRRYLSHFSGVHRIAHMHGFIHGHIAADRAKHTFGLSERECEAIARHMFPLAAMPRTRIAWIITVADKAVASKEMTAAVVGYVSHAYHKIFA